MPGRKLVVEIVGDARSFERALKKSSAAAGKFNADITKTQKAAGVLKGEFIGATAGLVGGAGLIAALKTSSEAASNLNEQTSKTKVVFGDSAKVVQDFSKNALGLAADQALEAAAAMGQLFRPLGFTEDAAADLSIQLTKLAVDLSSFSNVPIEESLTALRAALVGEFEPARRFGIVLSAATVAAEAMRATGKKTTAALTDQEKVQARINLIMRQSAQAQGDFARTSESLANQQKTLNANLRDLAATVGGLVNPTLKRYVGLLNDTLEAIDAINDRDPGRAAGSGKSFAAGLLGIVQSPAVANALATLPTVGPLAGALQTAFKKAGEKSGEKFMEGFQQKINAQKITLPPIDTAGAQGIIDFFTKNLRQPGTNTPFLDFQQANAEATKQLTDDLEVVRRKIDVLRGRLARATTLKAKTEIQNQINDAVRQEQAILQTLRDQKEARKEARKEAKRQADEEDKRAKERAAAARKAAREAAQEAARKLREATDQARQEIGTLFQGPVVAPTDFQRKQALGVGAPGAGGLLADIRAQTAQALKFENELKQLRGLGVGSRTIDELRGLGTAVMPQIEAILRAPRGQQRQLIQALAARESAARRIGQVILKADNVQIDKIVVPVRVDIDGKKVAEVVTTHQQKKGKAMPKSRSGRNAGQG